jgi:ABC-type Fe3+-hydroxamate transport system substrate-binding protein
VLGRTDDAAALGAAAADRSTAVLAELPGLDVRTDVLANDLAGDGIWVVADPDDGAGVFLAQLGMQIAPQILDLPIEWGRTQLSTEQIDLLDADLLIVLTNGTATDDIPGHPALRPVRSGAVVLLDVADVSALNTPSPRCRRTCSS